MAGLQGDAGHRGLALAGRPVARVGGQVDRADDRLVGDGVLVVGALAVLAVLAAGQGILALHDDVDLEIHAGDGGLDARRLLDLLDLELLGDDLLGHGLGHDLLGDGLGDDLLGEHLGDGLGLRLGDDLLRDGFGDQFLGHLFHDGLGFRGDGLCLDGGLLVGGLVRLRRLVAHEMVSIGCGLCATCG